MFHFDTYLFKSTFPYFLLILLAIEFLDEFAYGARDAAWPLIRQDLDLSYVQIGVMLSLPGLVSSVIEPVLGILAGAWRRRALILGGGLLFALSLLLTAFSHSYFPLLVSFMVFYPASGAFVSLSQAALMDAEPERREANMARWTFAGSLGVVGGPLSLSLALWLGGGWRDMFLVFALLALFLLGLTWRLPLEKRAPGGYHDYTGIEGILPAARQALAALHRGEVVRWLTLLQFSDLMLDILLGFLALYFVDVVNVTPMQASLAVAVWSGVGLVGDLLIIPLLERVPGLVYLRTSVLLKLALYPTFLLVPGFPGKLAILGILGLLNAGWYAILQARLYEALPGQSGTAIALGSVAGVFGSLMPLGLGWVAQRYNLQWSMWLLLLGPLALWIGLPWRSRKLA